MRKIPAFFLTLLSAVLIANCHGQPKRSDPLSGSWSVELSTNDIGLASSAMTFEFSDSTFTACTRQGADRDLLGFWKSLLGRWFTNDFKHGALINITDGKIKRHNDTVLLSGIFRSAFASYYFKGKISGEEINAQLLNGNKELCGTLAANKKKVSLPLRNYSALADSLIEKTKQNIYNRSVLTTTEWISFEKTLKKLTPKIQDDVEMELAFFYYASKLPFTHYNLVRSGNTGAGKPHPAYKQVELKERTNNAAYMQIKSFSGTAAEMDSAFAMVIRKGYSKLIVDLRDNPGGSVEAGMSFAAHVADSSFFGGVFLTQKWFEHHASPPAVGGYTLLPVFSEKNYDLIIDGVHRQEGLCLKVIPDKMHYKGKLLILVNGNTASTCEPLVYGLKQNRRAVIAGGNTAGVMLNGERFALSEGFSLFLPTADYYAADGYHIDKQGITPDLPAKDGKELDTVIDNFLK